MAEESQGTESTIAENERPNKRRRKRNNSGKARKTRAAKRESKEATRVSAEQLPRRSIEQSLRAPRALRDTLAGGPATWEEIASAMGISPHVQNKYYLWSAAAYNLVEKEDDKYSISELGRKILAPTSPNEDRDAIVQAVLTPVILSRFFTDYNGNPFPAEEHLGNILERRYGIPRDRIEEAKVLIRENGIYAGILRPNQDGQMFVMLDTKSTGIPQSQTPPSAELEPSVVVPTPLQTRTATEFDTMCFVITPIGEDESEQRKHANMILRNIIEPVVKDLSLVALRADQIDKSGIITQQVFECLAKAKICIADLSFTNPNAFYELGIRHMCKLPTVQIIRKGDKIPFDVSQGRTIKIDMSDVYSVMESVESAKKELRQHIKHALSSDYKGEDNPVNTYLPGLEIKIPR